MMMVERVEIIVKNVDRRSLTVLSCLRERRELGVVDEESGCLGTRDSGRTRGLQRPSSFRTEKRKRQQMREGRSAPQQTNADKGYARGDLVRTEWWLKCPFK
jgi:hypothetical protein